jgi:hypothetical protein
MIGLQGTKIVNVTPPAAIVDDGSYTTTAVDTLGWDWCTFVFTLGASDIAMAALKVQEDEDSALGSPTDVTGAIFGTSTNDAGSTSALPSATDDNKVYVIEVDCKNRQRYLDLVATAGNGTAGTYASCIAILSRGLVNTASASEAGCDERLIVG